MGGDSSGAIGSSGHSFKVAFISLPYNLTPTRRTGKEQSGEHGIYYTQAGPQRGTLSGLVGLINNEAAISSTDCLLASLQEYNQLYRRPKKLSVE